MRGQIALLTGLAALAMAATAAPASAQSYAYGADPHCVQQRQNRMAAGALVGGLAGAVLGNNLAARNAQTEGAVLGGAVGAAAGAAIGRSSVQCSTEGAYSTYGRTAPYDAPYNRDPYPRNSGYGYGYPSDGYPAQRTSGYGYGYGEPYGGAECRWGEQRVRDRSGRWITQDVYLCQDRDGVWRPR